MGDWCALPGPDSRWLSIMTGKRTTRSVNLNRDLECVRNGAGVLHAEVGSGTIMAGGRLMQPPEIVAEVGCNHRGEMEAVLEMIRIAASPDTTLVSRLTLPP